MTVYFPAYSFSVAACTAALATFSTGTGANSATASTGKFLSNIDIGDIAIHSGSAVPPLTYLVPDTPPDHQGKCNVTYFHDVTPHHIDAHVNMKEGFKIKTSV